METVSVMRWFFACAYEGGAKRPNVRHKRTGADARLGRDEQSVGLRHR